MSGSTTNLDLITTSQAQKEVTANALFDASSAAMMFGRRASTCSALTWGYYGGGMMLAGVPTVIVNGTVALTASATNYVEASNTGVVTANVVGFTVGAYPLYRIVTGAATVTSYIDYRIAYVAFTGNGTVTSVAQTVPAEFSVANSPITAAGTLAITKAVQNANKVWAGPTNGADAQPTFRALVTADLPAAVMGGMVYQGTWNATTNTPAIPAAAAGNKGYYYKVATAGTTSIDGIAEWAIGDWIVSNGTTWDKIDNTDSVSTVAGRTGAVVITSADLADFAAAVAAVSQPFDVHAFYPGIPTASAKVVRVPVARAVTFPDDFSGSYGKASANATASTAFDVQKNGTSVGTITFAAAASTATFVTSAGALALAAGDVISIIAPASPDATLADIGFVLAGTR